MRSILGCDSEDNNGSSSSLLLGEGTPENIYLPGVAERAKLVAPDSLIIAILRDPIDRAVSHYNMARRSKKRDESPYEEVRLDEERMMAGAK